MAPRREPQYSVRPVPCNFLRRSSPLSLIRLPDPIVARQGTPRTARGGLRLLAMLVVVHSAVPLAADDGEQPENTGLRVRVDIRPESIPFLMPGHWGTLKISAFNAGTEPANLLCTTGFEDDENLQFGRRIWVPPNSRLRTSHHMLAPARTSKDQQSVDIKTLLFNADVSIEFPLRQQWDKPQQDNIFRLGHDSPASRRYESN